MIQSLQSLRGIFALIIFFHHFNYLRGDGGIFDAGGDAGVAFFFVLSGFVLCCGYSKKIESICENKVNYWSFFGKRIFKLFPLHILCLLWALSLVKFHFSIIDLFNLLFLQAWVPFPSWYFSGNAVGWCLSDFVFFYLLFPIIAKLIKKSVIQRLIIVLFGGYLLIFIPMIPERYCDGIIYINPLSRLSDFTLGILLFKYYNHTKFIKEKHSYLWLLQIISVLIFILTIYLWYIVPLCYRLNVLWWPSICMIIYTFAIDKKDNFLNNRILVAFGDMSFSFYLVHVLYIQSFDILMDKLNVVLHPVCRLFLILSSLIVFSFLIKIFYEKPIDILLRKSIIGKGKQFTKT